MIRVPEQPAVKGRLVPVVSYVDIDRAPRRLLSSAPDPIPGAQEMCERTEYEVVLIVVMRNERAGTSVIHRLVIGVQEPPKLRQPYLIGSVFCHERVRPLDNGIHVAQILLVRGITARSNEAPHRGGVLDPRGAPSRRARAAAAEG